MFPATKDFLGKPAPPNYVAGLGRGASGFTTRSDIGPAREAPGADDAGARGGPRNARPKRGDAEAGGTAEEMYQDPDNETGLFATLPYDHEDAEADRVYAAIDAKMDERRKSRREAREREELQELQAKRPRIQDQFSDVKRQLASMSAEDWESVPEVGDLVGKHRSKGRLRKLDNDPASMRYTPVPDTALLRSQQLGGVLTAVDPMADGLASTLPPGATDGLATPQNGTLSTASSSDRVDLVEMGRVRKQMLGYQLDKFSDSASGSSTVDPRGYLTGLDSMVIQSESEIADIKRARTLLHAVTSTNPKHAPGWIAAARLEEVAGKLSQARATIARGCEECAQSEDIWLEAARLNPEARAKQVLAQAVTQLPQSVKIWLQAMKLESDPKLKKRLVRKALELIPNSIVLWKTAVSLEEDPTNARILLSRAVELVPLAVELWLALARLEDYDNARKVINRARKAVPTSHEIWLAAARLEEQQSGHEEMVDTVIGRAVHFFSEKGDIMSRDHWLKEAEQCEKDGFPLTCQAIVRATIGLDVDPEDQEATWLDDAEQCISRGYIQTARVIYSHAIQVFPNHQDMWLQAAFLEKHHGTAESLDALLKRAVKYCPQEEIFWLMGAKEKWLAGDVDAAREILGLAFDANPDSEQIWLAAIKLEMENRFFDNARVLLTKAREQANTPKIWMKSAMLERITQQDDAALQLLQTATAQFADYAKLWMIQGQIYEQQHHTANARTSYRHGTTHCPTSMPLWILAARLEEQAANLPIRARALLERARLLNPKTPELWIEAIRLEVRQEQRQHGATASASSTNGGVPGAAASQLLLAKALQECPQSGLLWAESLALAPRAQRKGRSVDAMKKCQDDPILITAIARLFWSERKLDKARVWFERAVKLDPDQGDTWAWWYKFEQQHGTEAQQRQVVQGCVAADPHHGERWQPTAKDISHFGYSVEQKLQLVTATLESP
ncbi:U4/U6 x U5 tri-snRNP complex subunit Prp1 [Dimargaris xerosporica]|nr:U4/U6 x U5 tri-snRNP complex subunit Prp1 [Dimargaris xerosporica]